MIDIPLGERVFLFVLAIGRSWETITVIGGIIWVFTLAAQFSSRFKSQRRRVSFISIFVSENKAIILLSSFFLLFAYASFLAYDREYHRQNSIKATTFLFQDGYPVAMFYGGVLDSIHSSARFHYITSFSELDLSRTLSYMDNTMLCTAVQRGQFDVDPEMAQWFGTTRLYKYENAECKFVH